jgi:hypothetical protein
MIKRYSDHAANERTFLAAGILTSPRWGESLPPDLIRGSRAKRAGEGGRNSDFKLRTPSPQPLPSGERETSYSLTNVQPSRRLAASFAPRGYFCAARW